MTMVGTIRDEYDIEDGFSQWVSDVGWNSYGRGRKYGGKELAEEYNRLESYPVYDGILKEKVIEFNKEVTEENVENIIKKVKDKLRTSKQLVPTNKEWHHILVNGLSTTINFDGERKQNTVQLIDTSDPLKNRFDSVSQFEFTQGTNTVRPDIVLFVNGLPLCVGEVKNSSKKGVKCKSGIQDIKQYERDVPRLFYPNLLNFAVTQFRFRYGATEAPIKHHFPWRPEDLNPNAKYGETGYDVEEAVKSLLQPERVIQILRHYVFYDNENQPKSKVVPRHQQFFAVERIRERVERVRESPDTSPNIGSSGLIWHTQGSGKSYAMFYAARYQANIRNQLSVILVDRDKLRRQMYRELSSLDPGFNVVLAENAEDLADALNDRGKIVLTTLQLFGYLKGNKRKARLEDVRKRDDCDAFVFTDEAHRYMEKDLGSKLSATLPDAHHFGFTGTPVQEGNNNNKRNTFDNYAMKELDGEKEPYLHRYSLKRGCDEGVIEPVDIVSQADSISYNITRDRLDSELQQKYPALSNEELAKEINQSTTERELAELDDRIEAIAEDIFHHFDRTVEKKLKGMVVASSRKAAAKYATELEKKIGEENVEAIYTSGSDDGQLLSKYHKTNDEMDSVIESFKKSDKPKILVVCNMLLTGFDASVLKTIYLDKPLKQHRLMQAIARTNRPEDGKQFGQIVEYRNVFKDVQEWYNTNSVGDDLEVYLTEDKEQFIEEYRERLNKMEALCVDFAEEKLNKSYPSDIANKIVREQGDKEKFKQLFEETRKLRRAIQPDPRIASDDDIIYYIHVYEAIRNCEEEENLGKAKNEEEFRQDLQRILKQSVSVKQTGKSSEKHIKIDSGQSDNLRVLSKQSRLEDILDRKTEMNPSFQPLAEQVESIIDRWGSKRINTQDTLEELDNLESEIDKHPDPYKERRQWLESVVQGVIKEKEEIEIDEELVEIAVEIAVDVAENFWPQVRKMDQEKQVSQMKKEIMKKSMMKTRDTEIANSDFPVQAATFLTRNMNEEMN